MTTLAVGQKVFVVRKTYRRDQECRKGYEEVTSVGRKYFYTGEGYLRTKFSIETMREAVDGSHYDTAYFTEADYETYLSRCALESSVISLVQGWSWTRHIPTDKLQVIHDIIKEHQ